MDQIEQWAKSMTDGTFDWSLLDPDVIIWHSTDGADMTLDEERRLVEASAEAVGEMRAVGLVTRRHHRGALLDYVLHVTLRDGSTLDIPSFALVSTVGGRITRVEEYTEISDVDVS